VTAMMFAIGMSILGFLYDPSRPDGPAIRLRYATGLMLMTTFGASVGGLATPVGSAPNMIGLGYIRSLLGVEFPFLKWCAVGVPAAVFVGSDFGASEVSGDLPHPAKSSSEAAPQLIKNFFIFKPFL